LPVGGEAYTTLTSYGLRAYLIIIMTTGILPAIPEVWMRYSINYANQVECLRVYPIYRYLTQAALIFSETAICQHIQSTPSDYDLSASLTATNTALAGCLPLQGYCLHGSQSVKLA